MTEMMETAAAIMPHSRAAEEALLGAILIDPEAINGIPLAPDDFYLRKNAMIWDAMQTMRASHAQIDFVTVANYLDARHLLGEIGGHAYLMSLINQTPTSMHARAYAETIRERSTRRRILQVAQDLGTKAFDADANLEEAVSQALDQLSSSVVKNRGARRITEYIDMAWDEISAVMANPKGLAGIPTGFPDWDKITGGLIRGEKILLSGPPGLGKSLLAMQVLVNVAAAGHPVALYELEMSAGQVIRRTISAMTKAGGGKPVTTGMMLTGVLTDDEATSLVGAVEKLAQYPVFISETSEMTTIELRADLTRMVEEYGVEVFVLDYEGLLSDMDGAENDIVRQRLISKRVKAICKDLNLCGIVISDMTKAGITGERGGQGAVAGSARSLHDADQIIVMRLDDNATRAVGGGNKTVVLTWEKLREGEANRFARLVKLAGYPMFGSVER